MENDNEMEMPCKCQCGNWFDLDDGYASQRPSKKNIIVCEECHNEEQKLIIEIEEIKDRLYDLYDFKGTKKETDRLEKRLDQLENEL